MPTQIKLGELLRRYRLEAGLTQPKLGKMLNYNASHISRIERNEQEPSEEYIESFVMAFELIDEEVEEIWRVYRGKTVTGEKQPPRRDINYPLQRPSRNKNFTGREIELKKLLNYLKPHRVVSIIGPGGIGKSALATEVLWLLTDNDEPPEHFPDGIIWYSFYNQPDVEQAFIHIVKSFGEKADKDSWISVTQRLLSVKQVLIVLDGTEVANDLLGLLEKGGKSCILVNSRSIYDVYETEYALSIEPLTENDAISMLQKLGGSYALDTVAVSNICHIVGYLPLAVNLAGSYLAHTGEYAEDYFSWLIAIVRTVQV